MKLAWASDVHFDHAGGTTEFLRLLKLSEHDALMLTGDIGNANETPYFLKTLATWGKPVYFVLGNHDFYESGLCEMRERIAALRHPNIRWLSAAGVVSLTEQTALVGHEGWADGRYADWMASQFQLADFRFIRDLRRNPRRDADIEGWHRVLARQRAEADASAEHIYAQGTEALKTHEHLIVATHVPPFRENATYEGKISDDNAMPHFSCKAVGDALLRLAIENPRRAITCYCGHSHGAATHRALPNLTVYTAWAEYREPQVYRVVGVA